MRKIKANDELMTTREAGELLGVAVRTVQLWVESGVLPAWRTAGGHRRISRSAVDKLMSERAAVFSEKATVESTASNGLTRILLVEDDPDLMQLFSLMVDGWKFPVEFITADNGFDGLVKIGQLQPDMVITDLNMPGMDGFGLVRSLRRPDANFLVNKLVVITALGQDDIADRGGLPADVDVFHKPVPFEKIEALAAMLRGADRITH
jgi:excisionase family DNA binding protein